jgi:site-specific DNA recombinase
MTTSQREDIERVVNRSVLRAVIYARVSSDEQEEGTSLDSQVENCEMLARSQGIIIVRIFREAWTGKVYRQRKDLTTLRQMARNHEFDVVIVNTYDRLSRNQTHFAVLFDEFDNLGIKVICVKEKLDETPEGVFMRGLYAYLAERERLKILDRTDEGRQKRVRVKGEPMRGSKPKYGFTWVVNEKREIVDRAICEKEAETVREIYATFIAQRPPVERIARTLSDKGVLSPKGNKYWDKSVVYRILTDPIYYGQDTAMKYEAKGCKDYEKHRIRPIEERVLLPFRSDLAIIDKETWMLAQELLKLNKVESTRNGTKSKDELLRCGFIRCGYCKRNMSSDEGKVHEGGRTFKSRFYKCGYRYRTNNRCSHAPTISVKKIEQAVRAYIQEIIRDYSIIEKAIAAWRNHKNPHEIDLKSIENSIRIANNQIDQWVKDLEETDNAGMPRLKGRARERLIIDISQKEEYLEELERDKQRILVDELDWQKVLEDLDKFVAWCLYARDNPISTLDEERRALRFLGICVYIYRADDTEHEQYDIQVSIPSLSDIVLHTSYSQRRQQVQHVPLPTAIIVRRSQ